MTRRRLALLLLVLLLLGLAGAAGPVVVPWLLYRHAEEVGCAEYGVDVKWTRVNRWSGACSHLLYVEWREYNEWRPSVSEAIPFDSSTLITLYDREGAVESQFWGCANDSHEAPPWPYPVQRTPEEVVAIIAKAKALLRTAIEQGDVTPPNNSWRLIE